METMAVRVSDQEANAERSASEPVVFHFVGFGNGRSDLRRYFQKLFYQSATVGFPNSL